MAYIATSRHEDALDIVQDSMFTLAKNYSKKPENEWPGLFHRILQNKIRDNYRRSNVLKKIFFWQNRQRLDEDEYNLESVDEHQPSPERIMYSHSLGDEIDKALKQLPLRQQQTFLLRTWEGKNVRQTAGIMQISEGSVKTHHSRALAALRQSLQAYESGNES